MPSKIVFSNNINMSVQVGDTLAWMEVEPSQVGGFNISSQAPVLAGTITQVGQKYVIVDTDPAALPQSGTDLVNNGTFDNDINGWNITSNGIGFTAASWVSPGEIQIVASGGNEGRMETEVTGLTMGTEYTFSYDCVSGAVNFVHLGTTSTNSDIEANIGYNNTGTHTHVFEATTTSVWVQLGVLDGGTVNYDNVSLISNDTNNFWSFVKNQNANLSGIKGSYMEVSLKNNSTEKAELFSVNSIVSTNSK